MCPQTLRLRGRWSRRSATNSPSVSAAEHEPRPRDLTGGEAAERDLHEQEARAPDDAGEHELDGDRRVRRSARRREAARGGRRRWRGRRSAPGDSSPGIRRARPRSRMPRPKSAEERRFRYGVGRGGRRRRRGSAGCSRTSSATSPMITNPPSSGGNHSVVKVASTPAYSAPRRGPPATTTMKTP